MAAKIRSVAAISRNGEFRFRPPEDRFAFKLSDTDMLPPDWESQWGHWGMRRTIWHSSTAIRLAGMRICVRSGWATVANACESRHDAPVRYSLFVQLADNFRPTVASAQFEHDFAGTVVPSDYCEVSGLTLVR
jgi:hypothetical protein